MRSWAVLLFWVMSGCAEADVAANQLQQTILYDEDGRREYFESSDPLLRDIFFRSSVALIDNRYLDLKTAGIAGDTPSWSAADGVCTDQRFADQPAAAFCSGVLIDWDLVLTAGHCVRLLALRNFSVVFGYYYERPNALALRTGDIVRPVSIVAEALDLDDAEPRRDFAWLRLERTVSPSLQPVAFYSHPPSLHAGDRVITIGAPQGVPMKFEDTGSVRSVRDQGDFFVASTDTSAGWSGGAVYDSDMISIGILSRGAKDLTEGPNGCRLELQRAGETNATEQFSYIAPAIKALCEKEPSRRICSQDCAPICQTTAAPHINDTTTDGGCSFSPRTSGARPTALLLTLLAALARRRSRRPAPT